MSGKRIIVDTTNCENGKFEEIDRDAPKPSISIPSDAYRRNYDLIDWSKKGDE